MRRAGVIDERYIRKLMGWNLLLVCSGNTCRSPMAEAIARQILAERFDDAEHGLEDRGVRIMSAGTYASNGMPASPEAVEVVSSMGGDLTGHRSSGLTRELVNDADVIYCMTAGHLSAIQQQFPDVMEKVQLLAPDGRDVADPIGAPLKEYQRTAEQIRTYLTERLKEQQI